MQVPTKTIQSRYDYSEVWIWLQQKGKDVYGKKFQLYEEDKSTIYLLLCWFLQDDIAAPKLGLDLQKGILLTGAIGCGKTTLMNLMNYVVQKQKHKFITRSCRGISFEFIEDGFSIIHKYSRGVATYCFDDLGTEGSLKYYGNECNVMAEILLSRYDLFISDNLITHLTTNLQASEIEEMYGNRVRSRMREQFNLIAFDNESLDKRK